MLDTTAPHLVALPPIDPAPRVCLLMTVRNRTRFLEAALRSAFTQTFDNFHLIIVDDGSTDQTPDLAESLAQHDARQCGRSRCTIVRAQQRGRFAALRHAHDLAAQLAPQALLAWLDSDDLLVDSALEQTVSFMDAHRACGMVYTQHLLIDQHNTLGGLGPRCLIPYTPEALLLDFVTHHFRLFRPDVYQAIGGVDPSFSAAGDYDFCLKVSERFLINHLARPLYCYRVHEDSISTARQLDQINCSTRAIEAAMVRRGLHSRLKLRVDLKATYRLVDR